ncbi:MAG: AraC family transcriptional regulator [Novosphingobium sp.]
MTLRQIPHYFLYGERSHQADAGFVHVERITERWSLHSGTVIDHHHPHLHQLSFWLYADGYYSCDGNSHKLEGATLVWMPPGVVHGFAVAPPSDCIVISLSDDFVGQCLRDMALPQIDRASRRPLVLPVEMALQDRLRQAFERVEEEYRYPTWAQYRMIEAQVRIILLDILRSHGSDQQAGGPLTPESALFQKFLSLLDEQFRHQRKVEVYTALLGTTPYLLNQATQVGAGMTASAMMTARIIQEARRLLQFTALNVAEVAWALGHTDPAHFGRLFRRETGFAPGQWRDAHCSHPQQG